MVERSEEEKTRVVDGDGRDAAWKSFLFPAYLAENLQCAGGTLCGLFRFAALGEDESTGIQGQCCLWMIGAAELFPQLGGAQQCLFR